MEESEEVQSDERKESFEKNQKRRLKTPNQVKALEKFYCEDRYPREELKLGIAEQLGLTEKQVSGWFCHRRLKDKRVKEERLANGRHDHSNGIIQDLGSGLKQDSCGSTKQEDHWLLDQREVESCRLHQNKSPAAFISDEPWNNCDGNVGGLNDSSSESSSYSQEQFYSAGKKLMNVNTPNHLMRNGIKEASDARNVFSKEAYRPSGYLKVKCDTGNAAITDVKRQLGKHYKEDGPLLGIEFDPLPPGAFESQIRDASPGSYHVVNPAYSPDTEGAWRPTGVTTRHGSYDAKSSSKISSKGGNLSRTNSHDFKNYQSITNFQEEHPLFNMHVQRSDLDPSDMLEDAGDHVSAYQWKSKYGLGSKDKEEIETTMDDEYTMASASNKRGILLHSHACVNPIKKSGITNKRNQGTIQGPES